MSRMLLLMGLLATSGCVSKAKYDQLQKRHRKLKQEVTAFADSYNANLTELQEAFDGLIKRDVVEVLSDDRGRIIISMSSDVLFSSGSAELSQSGTSDLLKIGRVLSKRDQFTYQVEGHTDSDPISTEQFPNNWYLGAARAIVVVEILIKAGMSPEQVSAASFADTRPTSRARQGRNRRIELVVLPDFSSVPGFAEEMGSGE